MKSIAYFQPGPPGVLELIERPVPAVEPGHVRVRLAVAGVNPTDVDARRRGSGTTANPQVPGQDGAGTVDAVGRDVQNVRPGDRVWVWDAAWNRAEGTTQEYVVLPERQVVSLPDNVSFDVGASLGIPALTAHRALTAFGSDPDELHPGALSDRIVLVTGGAGEVGHAAIELASWAGARVISTVSSQQKAELATKAGADHVVNYRDTDVTSAIRTLAPRGVDIIVEVNAAENLPTDIEVIAPGGGIAIYTGGTRSITQIPTRPAMTKNVQIAFILTYTTSGEQKNAAIRAVRAAVADHALRVGADAGLPLVRFPLAGLVAAHEAVERHVVGKVLVDIGG
ncbi:NADPH:quinone reductase [Curtobacterium sp. BH-2-1-1]|uniref:NADPH:quinone reductase n=1 Tax=Curtobacterium sp. BH-2-1-1 TaxID=1905847 RepID=UPI00089DE1B0|nr:NADPH:quinone reductase [Curtobacterium sp. BH-2-1-1]AOX65176.1 NADPH:quinone reductase [Curtobacterium sp. BH-2-1-1]